MAKKKQKKTKKKEVELEVELPANDLATRVAQEGSPKQV